MIEITIDDREVRAALNGLACASSDPAPAMCRIAGVLAAAPERAFRDERDPTTGEPWAPLSPVTQARAALLASYCDLPTDKLTEVMTMAFAAADLAGRYHVEVDNRE